MKVQTDWLVTASQRAPHQPTAPEFAPAVASAAVIPAPLADEKPEPQFWNQPYEPEVLGQIALTYILVRFGEDLLIIDQHAAHERIRYLELLNRPRTNAAQSLLVPVNFEVAPDRLVVLRALLPALTEMGFVIEPFGGGTWSISAAPADLCD